MFELFCYAVIALAAVPIVGLVLWLAFLLVTGLVTVAIAYVYGAGETLVRYLRSKL